jgi:thiol:disulfide interchange protein DsbD
MNSPLFTRLAILMAGMLLGINVAIAQPAASSASNPIAAALEAGQNNDYLEPDQAFQLAITAPSPDTLQADFTVAPGHYLYKDRISFKVQDGAAITTTLPKGDIKQDPTFGQTEVYHQPFQASIKLQHSGTPPETITLQAVYQGCSEKGLCYAPIKKTFDIRLSGITNGNTAAPQPQEESDRIKQVLASGKLWLIAAGFFSFGLLLAFTPCVFPMLPILSGIIVGQNSHPTRAHAFNLSLAYTLGMAVTYALAGVAAGLSGHLISNALQNPWALGFGALVFAALALSMFEVYELRLPSALETWVATASNRIKGGKFAGVFAMGALSALLVSPCVAAPLAGALLYIGQTHDVWLGGVALFAMAMGMGVPLLALGLSAGTLLPKAGAWMNTVRNLFGIVMLGMAIWIITPVIPAAVQMLLWAALLIGVAIFLSALDSLPPHASNARRLGKVIGVIALLAGAAMLVGALAGSRDPLQPLAGLRGPAAQHAPALPFKPVKNLAELEAIIQAESRAKTPRLVMLDFYADWCVSCKEYEQTTLTDPRVQKALGRVLLLQADVTDNTTDDHALLARFGLYGPPGIVFFDRKGQELPSKIIGYQAADQFLVSLNNAFSSKDGTCPEPVGC